MSAPSDETVPWEPLLGLATTEQLLTELAVRMEITQNSLKGRDLGQLCREALSSLAPGVLHYRTVGYGKGVDDTVLGLSHSGGNRGSGSTEAASKGEGP